MNLFLNALSKALISKLIVFGFYTPVFDGTYYGMASGGHLGWCLGGRHLIFQITYYLKKL
jgi:hypothetical protein